MMVRLIRFALPISAFACVSVGQAGEIVTNYAQDMSRYPARVLALNFSKGTIDVSHAMVWGWWSVRFGEPTPVATPFKGAVSGGFLRDSPAMPERRIWDPGLHHRNRRSTIEPACVPDYRWRAHRY